MERIEIPIFGIVSAAPTYVMIAGVFVWLGKRVIQQVLSALGTAT